jgi:beta-glucosidase-like glycosyl hydrolase
MEIWEVNVGSYRFVPLHVSATTLLSFQDPCYIEHVKELVESGALPESLVDEPVERILTLKHKLGLFEDPLKKCFAIITKTSSSRVMPYRNGDSF